MSTKACPGAKLPRRRYPGRGDSHDGELAEGADDLTPARTQAHRHAGHDVPTEVADRSRAPREPPHERGTWRALGLSTAMHAVLVVIVLVGMHERQGIVANAGSVVAGRQAPAPPVLPRPHFVDQTPASRITSPVTRLAIVSGHPPVTPRPGKVAKLRHARVEGTRTTHVVPTRLSPVVVAKRTEPRTESPVDLQRETRLATLQAIVGSPQSGVSLPPTDQGAAVSPGYAEKIAHRLRANLVAPSVISGNPSTVIAVTCAPNGVLLSATVRHSSGDLQWDNAVLGAVEKSDPMPADVNGTTPASLLITFRAKG
ncbi:MULTISPECIES: energy transducer TonB [Burkholderia]|uniref:TonB C-terminal domain-containing protein n=1 Tax=Burkholderia contaminans TaxID=488447 RepID=A0A3N8QEB5_9BURK|nr:MULTISPECIES: energy transducer TonB [Burkholderia]MDD1494076.1 TonB C-terminal domain-containing protein [Burkholderia thailandensis]RQT22147.1 TonB C-terminal domain-containing protein [Burkholderia contaminans]